jgi:hypothetical protein
MLKNAEAVIEVNIQDDPTYKVMPEVGFLSRRVVEFEWLRRLFGGKMEDGRWKSDDGSLEILRKHLKICVICGK